MSPSSLGLLTDIGSVAVCQSFVIHQPTRPTVKRGFLLTCLFMLLLVDAYFILHCLLDTNLKIRKSRHLNDVL